MFTIRQEGYDAIRDTVMAVVERSQIGTEGRLYRIMVPRPSHTEVTRVLDKDQMKAIARWTPV